MAELHLSRADLTRWRDDGAGDRARIVAHLASCAACRHLAAELERERPPESDARPERFRVHDFLPAGRGAVRRGAPATSRRAAYLAAAASLVLAAVLVPAWLRERSAPATRGGDAVVALTAPIGVTVAVEALRFEWTAQTGAGHVRLVAMALDDTGAPVIDRDVTGNDYVPTEEERRRFATGRDYHWFVEYRGAGAGGGVSPSARFRVR